MKELVGHEQPRYLALDAIQFTLALVNAAIRADLAWVMFGVVFSADGQLDEAEGRARFGVEG
jgi:hypothetical protein